MQAIKVYCDTGGYDKRLKALEATNTIVLHQFKYENPSKRIRRGAIPSNLRYDDKTGYRSYDEMRADEYLRSMSYDEWRAGKSLFAEILAVVGTNCRADAQHLDSAQMTGCQIFLTSDKDDIWGKRSALRKITGLHIFHVASEWHQFVQQVVER